MRAYTTLYTIVDYIVILIILLIFHEVRVEEVLEAFDRAHLPKVGLDDNFDYYQIDDTHQIDDNQHIDDCIGDDDVCFQDFQLVFDLLARSHTAMARYVLLATVEQADLDGEHPDDGDGDDPGDQADLDGEHLDVEDLDGEQFDQADLDGEQVEQADLDGECPDDH